jgi:ACS family hexuronate transporter-like MFS transporter
MTQMTKRMRWIVLGFLLALSIINFIDRQTLSVLAPHLRQVFHLSNTDYGRIVAAFSFGMMAAEFPMGMLMDRLGARFGLAFAVAWWSVATAAHAVGNSMGSFALFRFWMGTGETGTFSGSLKVITRWFPKDERTFAVGVVNSGTMIGSMIAPPLVVAISYFFGWKMAFLLPATLGIVWAIGWRSTYRVSAKEERAVDATDTEPVPRTRDLLRARQAWALMLCRFLVGPVVQFYWYWLPNYLVSARGMTLVAVGALAWLPYLAGDVGSLTGGWTADGLLKRGMTVPKARGISMVIGGTLCLGSLAVVAAPSIALALTAISIVMFGHTYLSASMFAAIGDMFPESAVGRVTGLTGISGGLGGILFPLLTGYVVDRYSYGPAFFLAALMPLAGAAALFGLAPGLRPWSPRQR